MRRLELRPSVRERSAVGGRGAAELASAWLRSTSLQAKVRVGRCLFGTWFV